MKDNIEWLNMMIQHSALEDCKPQLASCLTEITILRDQNLQLHQSVRVGIREMSVMAIGTPAKDRLTDDQIRESPDFFAEVASCLKETGGDDHSSVDVTHAILLAHTARTMAGKSQHPIVGFVDPRRETTRGTSSLTAAADYVVDRQTGHIIKRRDEPARR